MFDDPTLVGPWPELAARLKNGGVLRRWTRTVPELADVGGLDDLLDAWADPTRTHRIGAGLVRLAAADGARDDDALLLLVHLLSGLVTRLTFQLADLSTDITPIVLSELTCQIRTYRWRERDGGLVSSLEKDTRRAVLAELRPTDRYHPERVERLTWDGDLPTSGAGAATGAGREEDLDVVDLLLWAAACGVDEDDLRLLVESERARGRRGARADDVFAQARGINRRTLLRRRDRTLTALRGIAPAYLAAIA